MVPSCSRHREFRFHSLWRVKRAPGCCRTHALPQLNRGIDEDLSKRPLKLDAAGYFLIKVDRDANELVAEHFTNLINKDGVDLGLLGHQAEFGSLQKS